MTHSAPPRAATERTPRPAPRARRRSWLADGATLVHRDLVVLRRNPAVLVASLAFAPLRREVPRRAPKPTSETVPYRWSRVIQRRPWLSAIAGTLLLLALALPYTEQRLAFSDEGNYPEDTTTRRAYDLLAAGFGPGFNGPLLLAAEVPDTADPAQFEAVTQALAADSGVALSPRL